MYFLIILSILGEVVMLHLLFAVLGIVGRLVPVLCFFVAVLAHTAFVSRMPTLHVEEEKKTKIILSRLIYQGTITISYRSIRSAATSHEQLACHHHSSSRKAKPSDRISRMRDRRHLELAHSLSVRADRKVRYLTRRCVCGRECFRQ